MAPPLVVLPIAAAAGQAIGAGLRAGGAFRSADAMMPEGFRTRLADLEQRERAGELGLTDTQRMRMEQDAARQRGAALVNDQARQLQQAQMLAGGGAFTGREYFQNEIMTQENQARLAIEAQRRMIEADEAAAARQMATMLELQQREADAEAARKAAGFNLAADIVTLGATAGVGIAGTQQYAQGAQSLMNATRGTQAARDAQMQMIRGQMAMGMVGAFGGRPVALPAVQPQAVAPVQPTVRPMSTQEQLQAQAAGMTPMPPFYQGFQPQTAVPVVPAPAAMASPPVPEGAVTPTTGYPGYTYGRGF